MFSYIRCGPRMGHIVNQADLACPGGTDRSFGSQYKYRGVYTVNDPTIGDDKRKAPLGTPPSIQLRLHTY